MLPFNEFPHNGRQLLGRPAVGTGSSRTGYGLSLQRRTGQKDCAYCGVSLVSDYYRWLLLTVDHVVPAGEARRLGIPTEFYEDAINLVLACSGCNGFLNRYRCTADPSPDWSLRQFVALRDAVFANRFQIIASRRAQEMKLFERKLWQAGPGATSLPPQTTDTESSAEPVDGLVIFTDNDAGYLAWLNANPAGFVVNSLRTPSAGNLILHRATCGTITGTPTRGERWTGEWIKVCAAEPDALRDWARRELGAEPISCGRCKPASS